MATRVLTGGLLPQAWFWSCSGPDPAGPTGRGGGSWGTGSLPFRALSPGYKGGQSQGQVAVSGAPEDSDSDTGRALDQRAQGCAQRGHPRDFHRGSSSQPSDPSGCSVSKPEGARWPLPAVTTYPSTQTHRSYFFNGYLFFYIGQYAGPRGAAPGAPAILPGWLEHRDLSRELCAPERPTSFRKCSWSLTDAHTEPRLPAVPQSPGPPCSPRKLLLGAWARQGRSQ